MENASKALIIAGAILLSILIISLGIMIFKQASGVVDSGAMDEVSVSTFNEKFRQYEGNNVRGSNVNSMIDTVIQNNLQNSGDTSKQVTIVVAAAEGEEETPWQNGDAEAETAVAQTSRAQTGKALTGKSYKVECTPDPKSGYITTITISPAK